MLLLEDLESRQGSLECDCCLIVEDGVDFGFRLGDQSKGERRERMPNLSRRNNKL